MGLGAGKAPNPSLQPPKSMTEKFRLILDQHCDGATNMARDEAISRAVSRAQDPELPTLRLYGWQPACVSLGQSQKFDAARADACAANGVGIVRRPTGGLAILHVDELTYSVSLPRDHWLAEGDVMTSYRRIAAAIISALKMLGVSDASASPVAKEDKAKSAVCFEAPSDYEVMGFGKKLVGSAQWRRVDAVMQHGSLPLNGDIARVCAYLTDAPSPEQVRAHAGTLRDVLGRDVSWTEAAQTWMAAFEREFGISFIPGELTHEELDTAEELIATKYASHDWQHRR